jgi:hypothetical protein
MPLKIEGIAINTMVMSIEAMSIPRVVLESATHLYCTINQYLAEFFGLKVVWIIKSLLGGVLFPNLAQADFSLIDFFVIGVF